MAKFRKNSFRKHSKKGKEFEKHGENKEKEEKEKKRSWWKWLNFVREHWSCRGTHSSHKKTKMIVTSSIKADDDLKVISNPLVTDIVEIPVESGEKISEILIEPTKTGIKAMFAQYRGPSVYPERPNGDKLSVLNDFSYEIKNLEENEKKVKKKCGKTDQKRLTWNAEVYENNAKKTKNKESLLTSALFIHKDMNKIVESAVFIEPHLPKDYIDSNKFDEISQKSIRINKTGVNYKILDEKNDQILKTFKTVSEPTWRERKKLHRQQRLQDNINNLLEQFMLLEVEDIIDLPLHQNKLTKSIKKMRSSQTSCLNSRESFIKELSRKVSPEILVNIKPFKEYVTDDYINLKGSSVELVIKRSKDHIMNKKTTEVLDKSKIIFKNEKISKENTFPVLKCAVASEKGNHNGHVENGSCEVAERALFLSGVKKDTKNTCCENYAEQILELVSAQPNVDSKLVAPCTVWGLYRSYSSCTSLVHQKENEQEKEKHSKNSLDEVLENLDDSDHDAIFQKNISQFRRKINVMPRLDVKKSVIYSGKMGTAKKKVNVQKLKKKATFMESGKNDFKNMTEVTLKTANKKQIGEFRFDCLNLWKYSQKQEKILENIFLQLSEAKMIFRPRIEATRIEARSISFLQTLREVHDLLESNNFTVIEIEAPMSFEKNLKNMELLWVGSSETLQLSDKPSVDVKKYVTVAVVLSFQGQDFDGKFCTTENDVGKLGKHILQSSKFFPNASECFYVIQNRLLVDYEEKSGSNLNALSSEVFSSTYSKNSKKTENDKEEFTSVTAEEKQILKLYEPLYKTHSEFCKVTISATLAEILSRSFYEYVACIYDWPFFSLETASNSQPEPDGFKNNLNSLHSTPTLLNLENFILAPKEKETPNYETVSQLKKNTLDPVKYEKSDSDFCLDGFQILYNNSKESLDDEEESIKMVFAKSLLEKHSKNAFLSTTKTLVGRKESQNYYEEEIEESKKKKNGCSSEEMDILSSLENKVSQTLKYKSNSSPTETIRQTDLCSPEHRLRRSLILSKETEKEFYGYKKKRLSFDKDIEVRKTGSASLESRTQTLIGEKSHVQKKSSFRVNDTFDSMVLPLDLKTSAESKAKKVERKRTFVLEKTGKNVRKEVVAAFNSIKELNRSKGGKKRMSVVIMLSRK